MRVTSGASSVLGMKSRTSNHLNRLKEAWNCKLKVKESREVRFLGLRVTDSLRSTLLKVLSRVRFWKEKAKHLELLKRPVVLFHHFKILLIRSKERMVRLTMKPWNLDFLSSTSLLLITFLRNQMLWCFLNQMILETITRWIMEISTQKILPRRWVSTKSYQVVKELLHQKKQSLNMLRVLVRILIILNNWYRMCKFLKMIWARKVSRSSTMIIELLKTE